MEKKTYSRPVLEFEQFLPNYYCEYCYKYEADLICELGQNMQYDSTGGGQHGDACADTHFQVNGKTGQESGDKEGNPIYAINVPDLSEDNQIGDIIQGCTWRSDDPGYGINPNIKIKTYYHQGYAKITSKVEILPGRPKHS